MKNIAVVLLLAGLAAASFDITRYLYLGETEDSVSYERFSFGGDDYAIVSVGSSRILLLKNDDIVTDRNEVEDTIFGYYLTQYYPDSDDIDELKSLLDEYNTSRNDGQKFAGKEEYSCRQVLFIDGRVKYGSTPIVCRTEADDELCQMAGKLMYQYLSSITGVPPVGSWEDLYEPIKEFGLASYSADTVFDNISAKMAAAETDRKQMYDALDYITESMDSLEDHNDVVETTIFGWTANRTCDSKHWCMCPDMDLDDSLLGKIEAKAIELKEMMGPFANSAEIAESVAANTEDRIEFAETESSAGGYSARFAQLREQGIAVIALGESASSKVSDATLSFKLTTLKSLDSGIPADIDARDFSTIDNDLADYSRLLEEVMQLSIFDLAVYNESIDAKNDADALMLVLESRELDPLSEERLHELEEESDRLDASFRDGITASQFENLTERYEGLNSEAKVLLQSQDESPVYNAFLLFRGFARKVNTGLAGFVTSSELADAKDIPENKYLAFGGFSFLVMLSFGAILLLVFLSVLVLKRLHFSRKRYVLIAGFLGSVCLLMLFSVMLFMYMEKTSTDASIEEYLLDFQSRDSAALVVDMRGATNGQTMAECAGSLASNFASHNKSVFVYELTAEGCEVTESGMYPYTSTYGSCIEAAESKDAVFMLNYSSEVQEPKFSAIYVNRADISANAAYFDSCPLVALFN